MKKWCLVDTVGCWTPEKRETFKAHAVDYINDWYCDKHLTDSEIEEIAEIVVDNM